MYLLRCINFLIIGLICFFLPGGYAWAGFPAGCDAGLKPNNPHDKLLGHTTGTGGQTYSHTVDVGDSVYYSAVFTAPGDGLRLEIRQEDTNGILIGSYYYVSVLRPSGNKFPQTVYSAAYVATSENSQSIGGGNVLVHLKAKFSRAGVWNETTVPITMFCGTPPLPPKGAEKDMSSYQRQQSQKVVSDSQLRVNMMNISTRFASSGQDSPSLGQRELPSGGRDIPSGERDTSFINFPVGRRFSSEPLEGKGYIKDEEHQFLTLRELAMLASFDTSKATSAMATKESEQEILMGGKQRRKFSEEKPFTIWGHGSYTLEENTRNRLGDDMRMDGDTWGYNLGIDYLVHRNFLAGLTVGRSVSDFTTTYNSGTYDEINWTISPYAKYKTNKGVVLSAAAGYGIGDIKQTRNRTIAGNTRSKMWFASVTGEYSKGVLVYDVPIEATARVNFTANDKRVDSFRESDGTAVSLTGSHTRRVESGVELKYQIPNLPLAAYTQIDYLYDFVDKINNDSDAINFGGGIRFNPQETGVIGSVDGEAELERDDYRRYSLSGMVGYSFGLGWRDGKQDKLTPEFKSSYNDNGTNTHGIGFNFLTGSEIFSSDFDVTRTFSEYRDPVTNLKLSGTLKF